MRRGRPVPKLVLTSEERETLHVWVQQRKTAQALALRARIVLACAQGKSNTEVAAALRLCRPTVGKWRGRFIIKRLDGLLDKPRVGAPRRISDREVERVITLTLESTPANTTYWSARLMARRCGMSHSTVRRIWRAFGIQPHRSKAMKLSRDHLSIEKVRDIMGLYFNPPEGALVLVADDNAQIQALDRTKPLLPVRPEQIEGGTHDYERDGTISLFAALEMASDQVIRERNRRHRAFEFRKFLDTIEAATPAELDLHLILDNYGTHKTLLIQCWLVRHPRYHLHFTPIGSSWITLVERWFAILTERQLRRGTRRSTRELETALFRYVEAKDHDSKPFLWTRTADEIHATVARFP